VFSGAEMPNVMRRHLSEKRRSFSEFPVQHSAADIQLNQSTTTTRDDNSDQDDDDYYYLHYYYDYDEHEPQYPDHPASEHASSRPPTVKPTASKGCTYGRII